MRMPTRFTVEPAQYVQRVMVPTFFGQLVDGQILPYCGCSNTLSSFLERPKTQGFSKRGAWPLSKRCHPTTLREKSSEYRREKLE